MELEQLRIFIAVAECGSFTKGAGKLYISHSTTSRTVSALENELGVTLIKRRPGVFSLTAAGKLLLDESRKLLAAADEMKEKIRNLK